MTAGVILVILVATRWWRLIGRSVMGFLLASCPNPDWINCRRASARFWANSADNDFFLLVHNFMELMVNLSPAIEADENQAALPL